MWLALWLSPAIGAELMTDYGELIHTMIVSENRRCGQIANIIEADSDGLWECSLEGAENILQPFLACRTVLINQCTFIGDEDGDGYTASELGGDDCDDTNAGTFPGADELCDDFDNDCDTTVDEAPLDGTTYYLDVDGDGNGDPSSPTLTCSRPDDYVTNADDCDDTDAELHSYDYDHDGYTTCDGDCDDINLDTFPGASELCDGLDNDCDATLDEGMEGLSSWFLDADRDGYGNSALSLSSCIQPVGYTADSTDCDDTTASIHPDAPEVCNSEDEDCDGLTDESATGWYTDADGDGVGTGTATETCDGSSNLSSSGNDCDDTDSVTFPGAPELCDGRQNDCDSTDWTEDLSVVSFESDGTWVDHTADWAIGIDGIPTTLTYDEPGTLHVCPDTWYVSLTLEADTSIIGSASSESILNGGGAPVSVISATSDISVDLEKLNIRNGIGSVFTQFSSAHDTSYAGGGLRCDSATIAGRDLVISASRPINYDDSIRGSGILARDGCELQLTDTTVQNISFEYGQGAGIFSHSSNITLTDSTIHNNKTSPYGGGIYMYNGSLMLERVTVSENQSDYGGYDEDEGAGLYLKQSDTVIIDSVFSENHSSTQGAAIWQDGGTLEISGSTFEDNSLATYSSESSDSYQGGAIYTKDGTLSISSSTFSNNDGIIAGGAIYTLESDVLVEDCVFMENLVLGEYSHSGGVWRRGYGGAMYLEDSTTTITATEFTQNEANSRGGAILLDGGDLVLEECTFADNEPQDVDASYREYTWEDTISATCDSSGCIEE